MLCYVHVEGNIYLNIDIIISARSRIRLKLTGNLSHRIYSNSLDVIPNILCRIFLVESVSLFQTSRRDFVRMIRVPQFLSINCNNLFIVYLLSFYLIRSLSTRCRWHGNHHFPFIFLFILLWDNVIFGHAHLIQSKHYRAFVMVIRQLTNILIHIWICNTIFDDNTFSKYWTPFF